MARAKLSDTAEVVETSVKEEILRPFGPPGTIVSYNAKAFTAPVMEDIVNAYECRWRTVAEYAPMSNGCAERMVGTIKRCIANTTFSEKRPWPSTIEDVLFG